MAGEWSPKSLTPPRITRQAAQSDWIFYHGTPDERTWDQPHGAAYGLHVGTEESARQALNSRIGRPLEGDWDGTREYGKTLLSPYQATGTERDAGGPRYPSGRATYSTGHQVPMDARPSIFPVRITGPMIGHPAAPVTDDYANARMRAQLTRGSARSGYFYRNTGEDEGSVSAAVPSAAHLERVHPPKTAAREHHEQPYVLYHGAHHDDVPSIMASGLRGEPGQPTVTDSREGAGLYAGMRDWTAPKVLEIHVPRSQAARYLEEGHEGTPIEGTVHALKDTLPPGFIRAVHEARQQRTASRWSPSSGIFGPTTGLDQDLFDEHGRLRPDVRHCVMTRLDQCIRTDSGLAGSDWQDWTRVYLLGGSVSEWAGPRPNGTARDLDVIVAIDLHEAQRHGAFEGMDPGTAASALNAAFHRCFNDDHWRPSSGGVWALTAFCNQRAWDVTAIRPYAAYDLTHGHWAVRPPHLPEHSVRDFDPAVIAHAQAVLAEARAVLRMPEPLRTREARDLWEHVHAHRCVAFGPEGSGWDDVANLDEKMLAYAPRNIWGKIRELAMTRTAVLVQPRPEDFAHEVYGNDTSEFRLHGDGYILHNDRPRHIVAYARGENLVAPGQPNYTRGHRQPSPVGYLSWLSRAGDSPPEIYKTVVDEEHRRRGVASAMLDFAREMEPDLQHSHALTQEGRAWAERTAAYTPGSPLWHGSLTQFAPGTVLTPENAAPGGSVFSGDYVYAASTPEAARYFGSMHDDSPDSSMDVHVHRVEPVGDLEPDHFPAGAEDERYREGNYKARALRVIDHRMVPGHWAPRTATAEQGYWIDHRPPGPGATNLDGSLKERGESIPYHQVTGRDPEHPVDIYRSAPRNRASINPGDWVTTHKDWAQERAEAMGPDHHVIHAQVPARHVYLDASERDDDEAGYHGPPASGMPRTASAQGYLRNPYHGNPEFGGRDEWSQTWFHGTKGKPEFGLRQRGGGEADRLAVPPEQRDMRGMGWSQPNQHLGVHFSPLHEVGHKFAGAGIASVPSAIVHARLRGGDPAHFRDESHLNIAMADWGSQHYPHWHDEKLNGDMAWNYSDREGTHRDFSQVPEDHQQRHRLGHTAQSLLTWHPHMPEILQGFKAHLRGQGHHGITYGNELEGPYLTDATRGGQAAVKYEQKNKGMWGTPRSISAIADPGDIEVTHVEHIAPWRAEPEPHQRTWEDASEHDEPDAVRDRVLDWHRAHGGELPEKLAATEPSQQRIASWDSSGSERSGVYLRFGHWPENEKSYSPAGGYHEEGVSTYDLDKHGEPAIDHGLDRGHQHDQECDVDDMGTCQFQAFGEEEPDNDPKQEMQGRKARAERNRYYGTDKPGDTGHLVRGERSGVGYDGEPLLKNVRRVGDWIDHRHLFLDQAHPHHLARDPSDEDYEEPEEKPPYGHRNRTAAVGPETAVRAAAKQLPGWQGWTPDEPHKAVIHQTQEAFRPGHPELTAPLDLHRDPIEDWPRHTRESEAGGEALRRILEAAGHPGAEHAWVEPHPHPERRVSQPAVDAQGHVGVALLPGRWDQATLAHEAAHIVHARQSGIDLAAMRHADADEHDVVDSGVPDHVMHGPEFARHYADALDVLSPGAGGDFLRHHAEKLVLVGNQRHRVHGLPREYEGSQPARREASAPAGGQQRPKRTPGNAMVYLEVPHGTVQPYAGQEGGHHVALAYLPRAIGDEDFARVVDRAREAATRYAPMKGTVGGHMTFPPGAPSDKRRVAVVPAEIPGVHGLQREFGEFDRAHYEQYTPHVTRAQLTGNDPDPEPHPQVQVPFTHVHVRRGDEVHSFPLTGANRVEATAGEVLYHSGGPDFPTGDWMHVGTRDAAMNRARDWALERKDRGEPGAQVYLHRLALEGRRAGTETDAVVNQPGIGDHFLKSGHTVVPYVNEYEDPGSVSYLAHRSAVRLLGTEPLEAGDPEDHYREQMKGYGGKTAAAEEEQAYYHVSPHRMPYGTILRPPGRGAGNWDEDKEGGHVYVTPHEHRADQYHYLLWQQGHRDLHVYQVQPHGKLEQDPNDVEGLRTKDPVEVIHHLYGHDENQADDDDDDWFYKHESRTAASGYDLEPRSGMIYLDLPPGTVRPVPGGTEDHHITICYLGSGVSDKAFEEACKRAKAAAAGCPPLEGVLRGIDIFPPSPSSDGKVVAFVPAYVGGIGRLYRELEDLSASEHKDPRPHCTLAYLGEGDGLPAPHPAVPLRFTHLHVKCGDEVRSYPLGGDLKKTAAAEQPSQYLYHASSARNRDSILQTGLDHQRGFGKQVYLGTEGLVRGAIAGAGHDIWKVDVTGAELRRDPFYRRGGAYTARQSFSPDKLELVKEGDASRGPRSWADDTF